MESNISPDLTTWMTGATVGVDVAVTVEGAPLRGGAGVAFRATFEVGRGDGVGKARGAAIGISVTCTLAGVAVAVAS